MSHRDFLPAREGPPACPMTPGPQASIPAGSPGEGAGFPCCGGTGMALAGYGDMVSQDGLAPCHDCTGAGKPADAPGERDGVRACASAEPLASVSPHAGDADAGGAGTFPREWRNGSATAAGPGGSPENADSLIGGVRGGVGAGSTPASRFIYDGTAWAEPAPARRRLHPIAVLALLLAALWLALMAVSAVVAVDSMTNALRGK